MERIIKTYESFSPLENTGIDIVTFERGDDKKLAALVKALDHGRIDLANPMYAKRYLDKGPIHIINSEYYYQPSGKIIVDSQANQMSIEDLINIVGLSNKEQIMMLESSGSKNINF
jgi:hypothetical protein